MNLYTLLYLALVISHSYAHKEGCCINKNPTTSNYDCSQLDSFGAERCNQIFNGAQCSWKYGKDCHNLEITKCKRVSYYQYHYTKLIDVGRCIGGCSDNKKCTPRDYYYISYDNINKYMEVGFDGIQDIGNVEDREQLEPSDATGLKKLKVIKSCDCDNCDVEKYSKTIEIPLGKCVGNCSDFRNINCLTGLKDNFDTSNGIEPSYPSALLLSNFLLQCSAGIQAGFDTFANDRCFGHTFTNCIKNTNCNIRRAVLDICLQAAQVPLTHTDSLILGFNGVPVWSKSLVALNGGSWNRGEVLCLSMNLRNLPIDYVNILPSLEMIGHLDVGVQDDTAVDYAELVLEYEECEKCIPRSAIYSTFITGDRTTNYRNVDQCECADMKSCERRPYHVSYYPGTLLEQSVDLGLCMGKCERSKRCVPDETELVTFVSLDSSKINLNRIKSCKCGKLTWNGNAVFSKQ